MTSAPLPRRPRVFDADDPALSLSKHPQPPLSRENTTDNNRAETSINSKTSVLKKVPPTNLIDRGIKWGMLLFSSFSLLILLTTGVWFARFISVVLKRDDWIGWTAQGILMLGLIASAVLVLKELIGFLRMARLSRIRRDAEVVLATGDRKQEERIIKTLKALAKGRHARKWCLAAFREEERFMKETGRLIGLADRVLLTEADKEARRVIFESARRVGVVTAIVPIALLVALFALGENIRMVRRLADVYGGQPGLIGGIRLLWRIIMHVAATGAVALTDDLFGQFLGQDIVRRLSRRLGEGAFVGALTARLGVAAIEICRPLPFVESAPVRSRHIIRELFPEFRLTNVMDDPIKDMTKKSEKYSRY
ncbi:MAG: hypothetical protein TECD_00353 [Hyphomicrobiaceae bacterium hypho_1]